MPVWRIQHYLEDLVEFLSLRLGNCFIGFFSRVSLIILISIFRSSSLNNDVLNNKFGDTGYPIDQYWVLSEDQ